MDEHAEFDYGLIQQYLQGIAGGNRSQETAAAITHAGTDPEGGL